jgi:hypothetical protein
MFLGEPEEFDVVIEELSRLEEVLNGVR